MQKAERPGHKGSRTRIFLACTAALVWIQATAAQVRPPLDLVRSEADAVLRFTHSLTDYHAQFEGLKKVIRPSGILIDAVETRALSIRSLVPGCVQNLGGFISKLKGAAKWTGDLDVHFERVAASNGLSSSFVNEVKQAGGARATLEKGLVEIGQLAVEIDQDLVQIRSMKGKPPSSTPGSTGSARAIPAADFCLNMRTLATVCVLMEQIACARGTIIGYTACVQK